MAKQPASHPWALESPPPDRWDPEAEALLAEAQAQREQAELLRPIGYATGRLVDETSKERPPYDRFWLRLHPGSNYGMLNG